MKHWKWIVRLVFAALLITAGLISLPFSQGHRAQRTQPVLPRAQNQAVGPSTVMPGSPVTGANVSPAPSYSFFGRAYPLLAQRDESVDGGTANRRSWLVDTVGEFGRVRIEAPLSHDRKTGAELVGPREAYVAGDVIVYPAAHVSTERLGEILARCGATAWERLYGSQRWVAHFPEPNLDTKPRALAALAKFSDEIVLPEGNGIGSGGFIPNDVYFPQQYAFLNTGQTGGTPGADIQATAGWEIASTSPDVVVAVLDSGIDFTHPDLQENIYTDAREIPGNGVDEDRNGLIDDVHGWDFVNNDNDPSDDYNHGTHVSGILGARGNNNLGVVGVTWRVQIMPVKILNASNLGTTAALISGINYARLKGARLMNLSLQNYPFSSSVEAEIQATQNANILMVICAGNNGTDNDQSPNYPSSYPNDNILAVANTTQDDVLKSSPTASDYGATSVDLAAPGTSIYNTIRGGYGYFTGTSMAAPLVTGTAALLLELHPGASVSQLRHWIMDTVDPLPALAGKCVTGGRLNLAAAIVASLDLPTITASPTTQVAEIGSVVYLGVSVQGNANPSYQWMKDGTPLLGATSDTLTLSSVQPSNSGSYSVAVGFGGRVATSRSAQVTVQAPGNSRIVNLSVRATAGSGNQTLITGFIVEGDGETVLLRGVGPTLARYGVSGPLSDPLITLYQGSNILASNDDWSVSGNAAQVETVTKTVNAFDLPPQSKDATLLRTFSTGGYTVLCTSAQNGGGGVALLELYDADTSAPAHLINVSGRSQVGTGSGVLIGGFVVSGSSPRTLLIRGIGPTLAAFGVGGALADPKLTVSTLNGPEVAENDDWGGTAELVANFKKVGAFDLPRNSKDAALMITLNPGAYTAVVNGVGETTGVGLIEIYEVK